MIRLFAPILHQYACITILITHQLPVANLLLIKHAMELKVTIESHHTNAFYDFKITNCNIFCPSQVLCSLLSVKTLDDDILLCNFTVITG